MRRATLAVLLALVATVLIPACEQPVEPEVETPPAAEDHEFDTGSRIDAQEPTNEGLGSAAGSVLNRAISHVLGHDFVPAADRSGSKSAAH